MKRYAVGIRLTHDNRIQQKCQPRTSAAALVFEMRREPGIQVGAQIEVKRLPEVLEPAGETQHRPGILEPGTEIEMKSRPGLLNSGASIEPKSQQHGPLGAGADMEKTA